MKVLVLLIGIIFFQAAWADEGIDEGVKAYLDLLKSSTPNELRYYIDYGAKCELGNTELINLVEGTLIRSRIKPIDGDFETNDLYLNIFIGCEPIVTGNRVQASKAVSIIVRYGKYTGKHYILYDWYYSAVGVAERELLLRTIQRKVEEALVHYMKANFNL